jgi:hypothetical protein
MSIKTSDKLAILFGVDCNKKFRSCLEAREFSRKLGLKTKKEWKAYCRSGNKPNDIPIDPSEVYKNKGWAGWLDWLGNSGIFVSGKWISSYPPFLEAREFVIKLGLKTRREYKTYCKSGNKPNNIPANPSHTYKNKGWKGYADWLGNGRKFVSRKFVSKIPRSIEDIKKIQEQELKRVTHNNRWMNYFFKLKEFVNKYKKHPSLNCFASKKEKKIASWVSSQRYKKKIGILSEERRKQLESIVGFKWSMDEERMAHWFKRLNCLKEFIIKNNRFPSKNSKNKREARLAEWRMFQNSRFKKGNFSEEQNKQWKKIVEIRKKYGLFGAPCDEIWQKNRQNIINKLKEFIIKNNRFPSKRSKNKQEVHLGNWCAKQKRKQKSGKLSKTIFWQIESSNIKGWEWLDDGSCENKIWQDNINELLKYVKKNRKLPSRISKNRKETKLREWFQRQKKQLRAGEMGKERKQKLVESGLLIMFPGRKVYWQNRFNSFKEFVECHHKIPSKRSKNKEEKSLGEWLRRQKNNSILTKNEQNQLKNIVVNFPEQTMQNWKNNFNLLKEFIKNNHKQPLRKTAKNREEQKLCEWSGYQKDRQKKGKLSKEKQEQLENIIDWKWRV